MNTIDDLRRAMADETEGLGSRLTVADIRAAAAARRRWRSTLAVFGVALLPILGAGTFAALQTAGPTPAPTPGPTAPPAAIGTTGQVPISLDPQESMNPPAAGALDTGLTIAGGEHLVVWANDFVGSDGFVNGQAGLRRETGEVRRLDSFLSPGLGAGFGVVWELDDRSGGLIDYGIVGTSGVKVSVAADGKTFAATTARPDWLQKGTLFWVRRTGAAARPTGEPAPGTANPAPAGGADAEFKALNAAGATIASTKQIQRSDGAVNRADSSRALGDSMPTNLVLADGGLLIFWFDGDDKAAMLHAGSISGGTVKEIKNMGSFNRPPFAIGFYGGLVEFPLAGGGRALVVEYAGPAAQVRLKATGGKEGAPSWSLHPELRIVWTTGDVGAVMDAEGQTLDAQGRVLSSERIFR